MSSTQQTNEEVIFNTARKIESVEARQEYLAQVCAGSPALPAAAATKGGTQVEIPHQATVVVNDIRNAMIACLRTTGSANRSATVKRVSA